MPRRRLRGWRAWAASAAAHALLALVLVHLPSTRNAPAPPPQEAEVDVDLEITDIPDPAPALPVPAAREPERAPQRPSARPVRQISERTQPPPESPPAGGAPSAGAPAERPAAAATNAAAPLPNLSFGALPGDVQEHLAGPPPPKAAPAAGPTGLGRRDVGELRAELERAEDAVANVRAGRVDPLLYDVLRGAESRFVADARRLADGLSVSLGSAAAGWGRGYLRRVEGIHRGDVGSPGDAPREGGGDRRNEIDPHADVLGQYNEAARQAEGGAEERRAEVCLDIGASREPAVSLRRGSGNAALDRLAIESFTRAAAARPVPADARRSLACYELRISAHRVPPLPVLSCDITRIPPVCVWPLKKVSSVKSRLVSVEYPRSSDERAGNSLLRRPR